jgi:hypothetical protein
MIAIVVDGVNHCREVLVRDIVSMSPSQATRMFLVSFWIASIHRRLSWGKLGPVMPFIKSTATRENAGGYSVVPLYSAGLAKPRLEQFPSVAMVPQHLWANGSMERIEPFRANAVVTGEVVPMMSDADSL